MNLFTKSAFLGVSILLGGISAHAQYYNSCREAYNRAQNLAFYSGNYSIKSGVERIKDVSQWLNQNVNALSQVANSTRRIVDTAGRVGSKMDEGMLPNTQQAYNNGVNTVIVLEEALRTNADAAGLKLYINNALNNARRARDFALNAANQAGDVKRVAIDAQREAQNTLSSVTGAVDSNIQAIQNSDYRIRQITADLLGSGWWNSGSSVDPYSKLGQLKESMDYLGYNHCLNQ